MARVPYVPEPLRRLKTQPRVRDFLAAACTGGSLSHAYLFVGAPGCGKHEAALALAQCVVCPAGGDGSCDECIRVAHRSHPDVRYLEPEGARGYLIEQVRTLIAEVPLAPVRASAKVYVIADAEQLKGTPANALLKTIEEPPTGVMFILLARSADAVLPTIVSRCQQVPFQVLSLEVASAVVVRETGCDLGEARIALSVCQTPERAAEFIQSSARRSVRRLVVRTMGELIHDDDWDVLKAAATICSAVSSPDGEAEVKYGGLTSEEADFLTPRALKRLEDAAKRRLTARERSAMMEAIAAAQSVLRDVLGRLEGDASPIVNEDVADVVERLCAESSPAGVLRALDACRKATEDLAMSVTPQLALEVMLLTVKEALRCHM